MTLTKDKLEKIKQWVETFQLHCDPSRVSGMNELLTNDILGAIPGMTTPETQRAAMARAFRLINSTLEAATQTPIISNIIGPFVQDTADLSFLAGILYGVALSGDFTEGDHFEASLAKRKSLGARHKTSDEASLVDIIRKAGAKPYDA